MSYKSKRTITNMVAGVIFVIAYAIYAFRLDASVSLKAWAMTLLVFIGIAVISLMVIQMVFHIIYSMAIAIKDQECEDLEIERKLSSLMLEDEMDKMISMKSTHIGFLCIGIGFLIALISLALGVSAIVALHILAITFVIGSIVEGGVSVYCYERGV